MPNQATLGPGGLTIEQLLAFHRTHFGNTRMENESGNGAQAGEASGEQAQQTTTPPATPATVAAQQQAKTSEQAATSAKDADGKEWTIEDAVKEITKLRGENAKDRTNAKEKAAAEARQEILTKLGFTGDGKEKVDPEKAIADLAKAQQAQTNTQRELAIYRASREHNADPDKLLDSRSFLNSVNDIDPSDTKKIGDAIKAAVTKNPSLQAQAAKGASSADHAGGSGEGAHTTPKSLGEALTRHYSGQ